MKSQVQADLSRAVAGPLRLLPRLSTSNVRIDPLVCTARVHRKLTTLDLAFPPPIYTDLGISRAPWLVSSMSHDTLQQVHNKPSFPRADEKGNPKLFLQLISALTMSSQWWLPRLSFFQSLRQSHYTLPVRPEFLASSSFHFVNPRHHVTATDNVTQVFPESVVAGLSDEEALALFTRGFFGGFVFGFERSILRMGGWNLLPARYTGEKLSRRQSLHAS